MQKSNIQWSKSVTAVLTHPSGEIRQKLQVWAKFLIEMSRLEDSLDPLTDLLRAGPWT
jgi:hypothetical protein